MKKISTLLGVGLSFFGSVLSMHSCKRLVRNCCAAVRCKPYSKKVDFINGIQRLPYTISMQELEEFYAHPVSDDVKLYFIKTYGYETFIKKLLDEEFTRCREYGIEPSQTLYHMHKLLHPTLQELTQRFNQISKDAGNKDSSWYTFLMTHEDLVHESKATKCYVDCCCEQGCEEQHDRNETEE